ncbi:hypothetical protein N7490_007294 [Penicillium lividum]|nr:hypothetical protein N7490_007294 [Penicillium lividum]
MEGATRAEAEKRFIKDRKQDFEQVARGNQNILHFLAKDGRLFRNRISLKWVAMRIMGYYPELMGQVDDQNRTPLSLAITERNDLFIRAYGSILDSEERTASNIEEFKTSLNFHLMNRKPKVSVDDDFKEWQFRQKFPSQTIIRETKQGTMDSHAWLECMDVFVKRFQTVTCPPSIAYKPIVVALFDDGVTLPHEGMNPRLFDGTSFQTYESDNRVSPYWISETGHGTLMARLIHRICPKAMIKVFKLQTRPTVNMSKVQIVESSAIEAIDDAVSMNVDVISMSWTVNSNSGHAFKAAIERAAKAKILMFCAASDKGKGKDINYPHNCSPNDTIRVGAVKASGQVWEWVPEPEKLDIGLPGHDVLMKHDLPQGSDFKLESHTGSSVATALAAGLAALILECVKLGHVHSVAYNVRDPDLNISEHDYLRIRTREGMMKG